ncbi:MAG TPA: putative sulfate exporter family transporter [Halobacteriales archaeon]|uniref:YeiH family protein n=1 Tax=Candidatus Hikarchaeum yamanae TaxID=2675326 RepID=UPI0017A2D281|nr:putative sulfate exporter family transporter [Halobacteriales archaeon]
MAKRGEWVRVVVIKFFREKFRKWGEGLLGVPVSEVGTIVPGLVLTTILLGLSLFLGQILEFKIIDGFDINIPAVILALLLGIILGNVFTVPNSVRPGIKFSQGALLRLGIVLIGIKLAIGDVFKLGLMGLPIIIGCIGTALLVTYFLSNKLNQPRRLGSLIAVGTSICGISAILATSTAIEATEEETAYAIAVVTLFGLVAVLIYPILGHLLFGGDPTKVGLWLGTSIQDTSQVVGAALIYSQVWNSPMTIDIASLTKVIRNVFMVIIIPIVAIVYSGGLERTSEIGLKGHLRLCKIGQNYFQYFPKFIIGFLILSMVRTIGDWEIGKGGTAYWVIDQVEWVQMISSVEMISNGLFIVALAGVGLSTKLQKIRDLGPQSFLIGFITVVAVGLISFFAINLTV